jgi:hypothetical protein
VVIAVCFLLIFFVATLWSVKISRREEQKIGPRPELIPTPREIGKPEIGMVNQRLFEHQLDAKHKRDDQLRRLNSYGWVDRDKQVIHIPIDQAMDRIARERKQ